MKKILLLLLIMSASFIARAQGIRFEQNQSWEQLQAKAKAAHKYIFVDCYATWCGPCKEMDQKVYPDTVAGQVMNQWFIPVKVQMDSTQKDDEQTRAWYASARKLKTENKVGAFPTFLFFSPDGKLVHKAVGTLSPIDFTRQALYATDPYQQEYTLLEYYRKGALPDALVPGLIRAFEKTEEKETATEIAGQFIHAYLLKLPDSLLYKNPNIELIGKYLSRSEDKAFAVFYQHAGQADKATRPGYAQNIVCDLITKEEIEPRLGVKPDWQKISQAITTKYNKSYADKTVNGAQIKWYKQTREWPELISAEVFKIEHYAIDSTGKILPGWEDPVNNINKLYFLTHNTDAATLAKAIRWQKQVIDKNPDQPAYQQVYTSLLAKAKTN